MKKSRFGTEKSLSRVLRLYMKGSFLLAPCALAIPALAQDASGNYVTNGGFERDLQAWRFMVSGEAKVSGTIATADRNSGAKSFRFTNSSPFAPQVYGGLIQEVPGLKPETEYEISAWVRGNKVDLAWIGGNTDWSVRERFPQGTYGWRRITRVVKTGPQQTSWPLVFVGESLTKELLLDDIEMRELSRAREPRLYAPSLRPALSTQKSRIVIEQGLYRADAYDASEQISGVVYETASAARVPQALTLALIKGDGTSQTLGTVELPAADAATARDIKFAFPASLLGEGDYTLRASIAEKKIAETPLLRRELTSQIVARLPRIQAQIEAVKKQAAQKKLQNNAYVKLGLEIAARYAARVRTKSADKTQTEAWSWLQLNEIETVLDETRKLIARPLPFEYSGTRGAVAVRDGVFVQNQNGVETPRFFGGYGHFGQIEKDLQNFTRLGVSIVQQERGPNSIDAQGRDNGAIASIVSTLKKAQAAGVKVNLLLSPHYFPQWAVEQAPDVVSSNNNFIKFNIDHPKAREAIEKWLRAVMSAVKDEPALFSVTLSNEPVYFVGGADEYSKPLFVDYLRRTHGEIAALNALYETSYARFEDVPVPKTDVPNFTESAPRFRAFYDWAMWNQEHFAAWHGWMNGIVKSVAPKVKTDIKAMSFLYLSRGQMNHGVDLEQFSAITDLAGNDNYAWMQDVIHDTPEVSAMNYAYNWQTQAISYDLQRSFKNQPVFNGENHIIPDRYVLPVPMAHTRAVMWQGALHGLGGTTTWVWEDTNDPNSDVAGSIFFRPANVFGAGRAWLDLQRLNREAAAITRLKPRIALLHSQSSMLWNPEYSNATRAAYSALNFLGEPVGFVTEKQLRENRAPFEIIVLPRVTHLADDAVKSLERFVARGGKIIALGEGNLARDEYARERTVPPSLRLVSAPYKNDDRFMWGQMQTLLPQLKMLRPTLQNRDGKAAFGVEYRFAQDGARRLLSLNNLLRTPQTVRVPGVPAGAKVRDLISGETLNAGAIALPPMQPRLLAWTN